MNFKHKKKSYMPELLYYNKIFVKFGLKILTCEISPGLMFLTILALQTFSTPLFLTCIFIAEQNWNEMAPLNGKVKNKQTI